MNLKNVDLNAARRRSGRAVTPLLPVLDGLHEVLEQTIAYEQDDDLRARPVWAAARSVLNALNADAKHLYWSEMAEPLRPVCSSMLSAIDRALDRVISEAVQVSKRVIADTYDKLSEQGPDSLMPDRALELGSVIGLSERLLQWQRLRALPLIESVYEDWLDAVQATVDLQAHISHMRAYVQAATAKATDAVAVAPPFASTAGSLEGGKLAEAAGQLLLDLTRAGHLEPDLAACVARCVNALRGARESYARQGRTKLWVHLCETLGEPGTETSVPAAFLRPWVWPVVEGEEKKAGAIKFKAGTHYKRHSDLPSVNTVLTLYRKLAQELDILHANDEQTPKVDLEKLDCALKLLGQSIGDAASLVEILYTKATTVSAVGDVSLEEVDSDADEDEQLDGEMQQAMDKFFDEKSSLDQERLWQSRTGKVFLRGDEAQVRQRLAALTLEEDGLYDADQFCVACARTATSYNYCHLHCGTHPKVQREVRTLARRFKQFAQILQLQRHQRFEAWRKGFHNPGVSSSLSFPIDCASILYPSFGEEPAAGKDDIPTLRKRAIHVLEKFSQASLNDQTQSIERSMVQLLDLINANLSTCGLGVGPRALAQRWHEVVHTLNQMDAIQSFVMQLASIIIVPKEVAPQLPLDRDAGSRELLTFLNRYTVALLHSLAQTSTSMISAQSIPKPLHVHFFSLWFHGGSWGASSDGVDKGFANHERDGNPNLITRLFPGIWARQIERWAIWKAMESVPIRRQAHTEHDMELVQKLKDDGMSLVRIAAHLGTSYDSLRVAVQRHQRRQALLEAGVTIRGRGRPRKSSTS